MGVAVDGVLVPVEVSPFHSHVPTKIDCAISKDGNIGLGRRTDGVEECRERFASQWALQSFHNGSREY